MSSNTKSELSRRIVGSKLWLIWIWVSAGIACLADIAVLVVLGLEGVRGGYYAIPAVLLALDAVVLLLSVFTNFRFRRALWTPIIYAAAKIVLVFVAMGIYLGDTVIFTVVAIALWLAFEAISAVCVLISAVYAKGSGRAFMAVTAVLTIVIVLFGALYMIFVSSNGFFGQNRERTFEKRTIVYTYYDDNKDSLIASDVLDGNGSIVVVPEEFNGLPVKGVDCSIFSVEDIDTVVLYCDVSDGGGFVNTRALSGFNDAISLYVDQSSVSDCRTQFYSAAATSSSMGEKYTAFANSIVPLVDDGNVFVSIDVDYRVLDTLMSNGEIPDVWVGAEGETFRLSSCYGFDYMSHMEPTEENLYWCYENFNKYILTGLTDSNGDSFDERRITSSVNLKMDLENVYAISVGDGNDEMYSEEDHGLSRKYEGTEYRYVTDDTADRITDEVAPRTGFTFEWRRSGVSGRTLETLKGNLSDKMTICPVWTLHDPEIISIGTSNSSGASTSAFAYGNTIKFGSEAEHENGDVTLSYEWTYGGLSVGSASSYTVSSALPSQSGTYTLTVTAGGDALTSLTASATASVYVNIEKRTITLGWTTFTEAELVYSGTDKTVSYNPDSGDDEGDAGVRSADSVTIRLNMSSLMKDAGTYNFTASLDSTYEELYVISNPTKSYTVTPYALTVSWVDTSFEYDGSEHIPSHSYSVEIVGSDTVGDTLLGASVTGSGTDAGSYTARMTISNGNYTISSGSTQTFTVTQKPVTLTWSDTKSFEYDGSTHTITASIDSLVTADTNYVSLTYTGANESNAGMYTITAALTGSKSSNYSISGDASSSYTITPANLTISAVSSLSKTYDAAAYDDGDMYTYEGLVTATDTLNQVVDVSVTYSNGAGTVTSAKDAGTYTFTISFSGSGKSKYGNYNVTLSGSSGNIVISQARLTLTWPSSTGFTYNAGEQRPSATVSGLKGSDTVQLTYAVTRNGSAASPVDVGSYLVTASLPSSETNYYLDENTSCEFSITAKTLNLSWTSSSLTYSGSEQHPTATVSGLEGRDNVNLTYSVSGGSGESKDVGSYSVTASFEGTVTNYVLNSSQTTCGYTISAKSVSLAWSNLSVTYNGSEQVPTVTVGSGVVSGDTVGVSCTYNGGGFLPKNAGSYAVVAASTNANYTFSNGTQTFVINKATITITWATGDNAAPTASVTGAVGGETVTLTYTYYDASTGTSLGSEVPATAGNYRVTITLTYSVSEENYTVSGLTEQTFIITAQTPGNER